MKKILLFLIFSLFTFSNISSARFDPSWKWRTVRTEHFTVYYPEGHESTAARIIGLSEEVHTDVTGYLGVTPRRCPIVINPGTDIFNGWYSPMPNRIVLYETPLYILNRTGPLSDLMDMVYTHEYTHYVHMTTRLGLYGFFTRIFGEGLAISNGFSPGWIIEGITTNTETMFTDGGRGRSPLFRGRMMSFTEGDGLWGLSKAGVSPRYSPPGDRIYLAGYYMVEYMNRTYGADTFPKLGQYQARHPFGGTPTALKKVTGKSPSEFYDDFLADFETQASAVKRGVSLSELPGGRVILSEPIDYLQSHFWTDNGTICVIRSGYGKVNALVEIEPDSGEIISEFETGKMNNLVPVHSIPGGNLVFGEIYPHPLGNGELDVTDLVVFNPVLKTHTRLTTDSHIYSADLSPSGETFVAARRKGMWIELVLLDADGSNIRTLKAVPGGYFEAPVWSPDGSKIAAVYKAGRNADIVLIDPENGSMEALYGSDIYEDSAPSFSSDGRWIVFSSDRDGIWNIHAWDRIEQSLYRLTSVNYAAEKPRISPDMSTLSFFSVYRGVNRLCVVPFDPLSGKPESSVKIDVSENGNEFPVPDLARLEPKAAFESRGIPLWEAYKPFIHAPTASFDEKNEEMGVYLMGADPLGLNEYSAKLLYHKGSKRTGYDIGLTNRSFWPVINVRAYDNTSEHNTLGGTQNKWYRERGGSFSLGQNVITRTSPSLLVVNTSAGVRVRRFDGLEKNGFTRGRDTSLGLFADFMMLRQPDFAKRDVVPNGSGMFYISEEYGIKKFGGEISGHNILIIGSQYLRSPLSHHGFKFTAVHQNQSGYLNYDKNYSIPRGYSQSDKEGGINMRKNLLTSFEYHFPLWYADTGFGMNLYHLHLLKGSLFLDYGMGWDRDFHLCDFTAEARTTVGMEIIAKSSVIYWFPVDLGVMAGRKVRDNESFVQLIMRIEPDIIGSGGDFKNF